MKNLLIILITVILISSCTLPTETHKIPDDLAEQYMYGSDDET